MFFPVLGKGQNLYKIAHKPGKDYAYADVLSQLQLSEYPMEVSLSGQVIMFMETLQSSIVNANRLLSGQPRKENFCLNSNVKRSKYTSWLYLVGMESGGTRTKPKASECGTVQSLPSTPEGPSDSSIATLRVACTTMVALHVGYTRYWPSFGEVSLIPTNQLQMALSRTWSG